MTEAAEASLETHRLCLSEAFKLGSGLWDVMLVPAKLCGVWWQAYTRNSIQTGKDVWLNDLLINLLALRLTDISTYFGCSLV